MLLITSALALFSYLIQGTQLCPMSVSYVCVHPLFAASLDYAEFPSLPRLPQRKRHARFGSYDTEPCHPRHRLNVLKFTANAHAYLIFDSSAFFERLAAKYALSTCVSQQLPGCERVAAFCLRAAFC